MPTLEAALQAIEMDILRKCGWWHAAKREVRAAIRRGPADNENRLKFGRVFLAIEDRGLTVQGAIDALAHIRAVRNSSEHRRRYTLPGFPSFGRDAHLFEYLLFLRWVRRYRASKWPAIVAALATPPSINPHQCDFILAGRDGSVLFTSEAAQ